MQTDEVASKWLPAKLLSEAMARQQLVTPFAESSPPGEAKCQGSRWQRPCPKDQVRQEGYKQLPKT